MAFCRAYPMKKMVPANGVSGCRCYGDEGFEGCPLYAELMGRLEPEDGEDEEETSVGRHERRVAR